MKKIITVIFLLLCIAGAGIGSFYVYSINKDLYNDGYANGNTAGNLYNNGLFCEYDGMIYFANPNDANHLYQMNLNGSDVKKLSDDSVAFINADENYVYYTRTSDDSKSNFVFLHVNTHSLCKVRRDGKGEVKILDDDPCMYASLVGNYLYYVHYNAQEASTLYRIKNDGKEKNMIFPQPYFTCSTNERFIYYNGLDGNHNVYRYDTSTGSQDLIYEGNCWMPIVEGNYLYFMDCDDSYSLAKVNLSTKEKITLANDRLECFNVHNDTIYFQRHGDSPALCSIRTDGSDYKVLKEGIFTEINVAGNFVFFKDYTSEIFYKMSIRDGWISGFSPAAEN